MAGTTDPRTLYLDLLKLCLTRYAFGDTFTPLVTNALFACLAAVSRKMRS